MRTVWLALFCLIGLATTVVLKIGMSPYASADVSRGLPFSKAEVSQESPLTDDTVALSSDNVTAAPEVQNGPFTKADKLEVSYTNEIAPEVKSVKSIAIVLPTTTEPKRLSKKMERIASRHWHDPLSVSAAAQPPTKRKASNTSTNRARMVSAHAPKS
jgi:hypothetical protein